MDQDTKQLNKVVSIDDSKIKNHLDGLVRSSVEETLTYYKYPTNRWVRIRSNSLLERLMREIRRRTRVVDAIPDGQSAH